MIRVNGKPLQKYLVDITIIENRKNRRFVMNQYMKKKMRCSHNE